MEIKTIMKKLRQYKTVKIMYENMTNANEIIEKISYIQKSFNDTNISPVSYNTIEKVCDNDEKILKVIENLKDIKKEDYERVLNEYKVVQLVAPIKFLDFINIQINLYQNMKNEFEKSQHHSPIVTNAPINEKDIEPKKDVIDDLSKFCEDLIKEVSLDERETVLVYNQSEPNKILYRYGIYGEIKIASDKKSISQKLEYNPHNYFIKIIALGIRSKDENVKRMNKCIKELINYEIEAIIITPLNKTVCTGYYHNRPRVINLTKEQIKNFK